MPENFKEKLKKLNEEFESFSEEVSKELPGLSKENKEKVFEAVKMLDDKLEEFEKIIKEEK